MSLKTGLIITRKNPNNLPQLDSVSGLISSYTRNNAAISGGASLIPGPWGMAAVIPELTLVIRNQIQMVYDIGVANGKQAQLTKELLMGIFSHRHGQQRRKSFDHSWRKDIGQARILAGYSKDYRHAGRQGDAAGD